jgi:hypothetical protein
MPPYHSSAKRFSHASVLSWIMFCLSLSKRTEQGHLVFNSPECLISIRYPIIRISDLGIGVGGLICNTSATSVSTGLST